MKKHLLIMILCCLIPLAGLGVAWVLGVRLGTLGIVALMLLCPLSHLLLMRGMNHKEHHSDIPVAGNPGQAAKK